MFCKCHIKIPLNLFSNYSFYERVGVFWGSHLGQVGREKSMCTSTEVADSPMRGEGRSCDIAGVCILSEVRVDGGKSKDVGASQRGLDKQVQSFHFLLQVITNLVMGF